MHFEINITKHMLFFIAFDTSGQINHQLLEACSLFCRQSKIFSYMIN
ncbi:hypothetical protein HMPREF3196_00012 [Bifidobacterium bifidum]|uniref:Uncharacterized protein n=1 Tax=Bifidobacterium bifidum TaxID=1681 RepID=A0A133KU71_BIFBI|nr:hypothetical protein HMPREF3196_00012 [Bifidobacterium bifidum]